MINKRAKGQGIVEYAGAILVATAIVAALVTAAPTQLTTFFNNVVSSVSTSLGVSGS